MGMPSTKAGCDAEIARLKGKIEKLKAELETAKDRHSKYINTKTLQAQLRESIASCKAEIAKLQAHKKTLK
jgi:uncharacterized small protein (DUF1192 family)